MQQSLTYPENQDPTFSMLSRPSTPGKCNSHLSYSAFQLFSHAIVKNTELTLHVKFFLLKWPFNKRLNLYVGQLIGLLMILMCLSCQGAWGGSLLMSRRHRWKLDGVERQVTFLCGVEHKLTSTKSS